MTTIDATHGVVNLQDDEPSSMSPNKPSSAPHNASSPPPHLISPSKGCIHEPFTMYCAPLNAVFCTECADRYANQWESKHNPLTSPLKSSMLTFLSTHAYEAEAKLMAVKTRRLEAATLLYTMPSMLALEEQRDEMKGEVDMHLLKILKAVERTQRRLHTEIDALIEERVEQAKKLQEGIKKLDALRVQCSDLTTGSSATLDAVVANRLLDFHEPLVDEIDKIRRLLLEPFQLKFNASSQLFTERDLDALRISLAATMPASSSSTRPSSSSTVVVRGEPHQGQDDDATAADALTSRSTSVKQQQRDAQLRAEHEARTVLDRKELERETALKHHQERLRGSRSRSVDVGGTPEQQQQGASPPLQEQPYSRSGYLYHMRSTSPRRPVAFGSSVVVPPPGARRATAATATFSPSSSQRSVSVVSSNYHMWNDAVMQEEWKEQQQHPFWIVGNDSGGGGRSVHDATSHARSGIIRTPMSDVISQHGPLLEEETTTKKR